MTPPTITIVPTGDPMPYAWYYEVSRRGILWARGRTCTRWGAMLQVRRAVRRAKRKGARW
jgi:hypothetical protein